jgi:hypothetical protein
MKLNGGWWHEAVEPSRQLRKHPTAADADVNDHIDTSAHNAISLETEVIHEGIDAHA